MLTFRTVYRSRQTDRTTGRCLHWGQYTGADGQTGQQTGAYFEESIQEQTDRQDNRQVLTLRTVYRSRQDNRQVLTLRTVYRSRQDNRQVLTLRTVYRSRQIDRTTDRCLHSGQYTGVDR